MNNNERGKVRLVKDLKSQARNRDPTPQSHLLDLSLEDITGQHEWVLIANYLFNAEI